MASSVATCALLSPGRAVRSCSPRRRSASSRPPQPLCAPGAGITPFVAALLALFAWTIALEAIGLSVLLGLLFTAFYTSVTLLLSSLTTRKSYAAAGVFAVTFGLTIPADILSSSIGNSTLLYVSPWEDYLAVARAAFGASGSQHDWPWALAILLAATVVASLATYLRMKAIEVVSG